MVDSVAQIILFEKELPQPGLEPGFLRPQRTVLTTRLLRQLLSFACKTSSYIMLSYANILFAVYYSLVKQTLIASGHKTLSYGYLFLLVTQPVYGRSRRGLTYGYLFLHPPNQFMIELNFYKYTT